MCVGGYYGDFVGVVACEVGVDEDEDVGDRLGEWERLFQDVPGMWVCIDYNCEERGS